MIFLTVEEVIGFHTGIIHEFGGAQGIREMGLLISAVEMPKTAMFGEYLHVSIYEKAAAYLFHIVCNHPFIDGNKRTGLVSALTFLETNKINMQHDEDEIEELVVKVANNLVDKQAIAHFFRQNDRANKKLVKP